jgi:hypothetical protein
MNTPRTDVAAYLTTLASDFIVDAEFARQLERELAAAQEEVAALKVERDAWKEFAQHQFWCADCAESVLSCDVGSKLQESAIEKERNNG